MYLILCGFNGHPPAVSGGAAGRPSSFDIQGNPGTRGLAKWFLGKAGGDLKGQKVQWAVLLPETRAAGGHGQLDSSWKGMKPPEQQQFTALPGNGV